MSHQAYQKAQRASESPRESEYRLFGQVTGALIDAGKTGRGNTRRLVDAIDWNRRLWTALATDCATDGNVLPPGLRAQIISLSIWVSRYSSEVIQDGAAIEPLIDVNRIIMQGLGNKP